MTVDNLILEYSLRNKAFTMSKKILAEILDLPSKAVIKAKQS